MDYIESSDLEMKRGFNSYKWGGYLIWRGAPVFIDGRADVYGDDFIHNYQRTFSLKHDWPEPLEEFEVDYVLMESTHSLLTLLAESQDWEKVYEDPVASIYSRDAK